MASSFTVNGLVVFGAGLGWRRAVRFVVATGLTMWMLQLVLIHLLLVAGPAPVAKLLATGITVVVNFLVYRFVVWPADSVTAPSAAPPRAARGTARPPAPGSPT